MVGKNVKVRPLALAGGRGAGALFPKILRLMHSPGNQLFFLFSSGILEYASALISREGKLAPTKAML